MAYMMDSVMHLMYVFMKVMVEMVGMHCLSENISVQE
jgi:hypothetical protein